MNDQPSTKLARIEDRLDRTVAGEIAVSFGQGGVSFSSMTEIMEFAKLMSLGGVAVPPHCRGNPGVCLAVTLQAIEWKMSPFAVANKSYAVSNKGVDRIAYESQLTHAVIEARAPMVGRLGVRYEGEGDDRVCIVSGAFRGETEPREWRSPPLGKRRPARNEFGALKGSPLWDSKPDLQQFYDCSRDWARVYCPDVLMGIYTPDEIEELPLGEHAKDVSPNLMERLPGRMGEEGFKSDAVANGLAEAPRKATRKRKAKGDADAPSDHDPTTGALVAQTAGVAAEAPGDVLPVTYGWDCDPSISMERIPDSAGEYVVYAEWWISQVGNVAIAERRWSEEGEMRDHLSVPIKDRNELRAKLDQVTERVTRCVAVCD